MCSTHLLSVPLSSCPRLTFSLPHSHKPVQHCTGEQRCKHNDERPRAGMSRKGGGGQGFGASNPLVNRHRWITFLPPKEKKGKHPIPKKQPRAPTPSNTPSSPPPPQYLLLPAPLAPITIQSTKSLDQQWQKEGRGTKKKKSSKTTTTSSKPNTSVIPTKPNSPSLQHPNPHPNPKGVGLKLCVQPHRVLGA